MPKDEGADEKLVLRLLQVVDSQRDVSQRRLASQLGIALGLTNLYLKRCVRKGLVKIQHVPANRYAYYLTPKGFAEKSRLTATYLSASFNFYRVASRACRASFDQCEQNGWRKVVLCGMSELGEIALIRSYETTLNVKGIYAPECQKPIFLSVPVHTSWDGLPEADAFLITDLRQSQRVYDDLAARVSSARIIVPDLLSVKVDRVLES